MGFSTRGSVASACARTPGANLDAQPAALACAVRRFVIQSHVSVDGLLHWDFDELVRVGFEGIFVDVVGLFRVAAQYFQ